ncbi:hypothetical protein D3C77_563490 [compost metagenome]
MPLSAFGEEWRRNKVIGLWMADEGYRLWLSNNRNRAEQPLEEESMMIVEARDVYSESHFLSKTIDHLNPQTLKAESQVGNWYKIQIGSGTGWIYEPNPIFGTPEPVDVEAMLELKKITTFYKQPFDRTTEQGTIAPMTVQASKKWGNWYLVMTPIGEYWIELAK